jgi:hypothetical protein
MRRAALLALFATSQGGGADEGALWWLNIVGSGTESLPAATQEATLILPQRGEPASCTFWLASRWTVTVAKQPQAGGAVPRADESLVRVADSAACCLECYRAGACAAFTYDRSDAACVLHRAATLAAGATAPQRNAGARWVAGAVEPGVPAAARAAFAATVAQQSATPLALTPAFYESIDAPLPPPVGEPGRIGSSALVLRVRLRAGLSVWRIEDVACSLRGAAELWLLVDVRELAGARATGAGLLVEALADVLRAVRAVHSARVVEYDSAALVVPSEQACVAVPCAACEARAPRAGADGAALRDRWSAVPSLLEWARAAGAATDGDEFDDAYLRRRRRRRLGVESLPYAFVWVMEEDVALRGTSLRAIVKACVGDTESDFIGAYGLAAKLAGVWRGRTLAAAEGAAPLSIVHAKGGLRRISGALLRAVDAVVRRGTLFGGEAFAPTLCSRWRKWCTIRNANLSSDAFSTVATWAPRGAVSVGAWWHGGERPREPPARSPPAAARSRSARARASLENPKLRKKWLVATHGTPFDAKALLDAHHAKHERGYTPRDAHRDAAHAQFWARNAPEETIAGRTAGGRRRRRLRDAAMRRACAQGKSRVEERACLRAFGLVEAAAAPTPAAAAAPLAITAAQIAALATRATDGERNSLIAKLAQRAGSGLSVAALQAMSTQHLVELASFALRGAGTAALGGVAAAAVVEGVGAGGVAEEVRSGSASGRACTTEVDVLYNANANVAAQRAETMAVRTASACCAACTEEPSCTSFAFRSADAAGATPHRTCWLHAGDAWGTAPESRVGRVSGRMMRDRPADDAAQSSVVRSINAGSIHRGVFTESDGPAAFTPGRGPLEGCTFIKS